MRPRVTLKVATSLDGRIATASGESQWITGEAARAQGHRLRAEHAAILVGVQTVLADDPELTVRLLPVGDGEVARTLAETEGRSHAQRLHSPSTASRSPSPSEMGRKAQPLRVVLDSTLRTPPSAKIASANTLIFCTVPPRHIGAAEVAQTRTESGRPAPDAVLHELDHRGVSSVLIEGGGQVAASFLRAGLVDRIEWFRAPILLGGEGRPCVAALALASLSDAPRFRRLAVEPLGDDLWERYERL
ncbi:deaminase [Brevundimonas sp. Leaf363]|uniref:RibD family protein n=1 Tax=Brevundimonas sp. Leaf363 TaxID=1736353 RepID=UPI0006F9CD3D|nr:RibD family protein [Brevundimonas sp. Leaf363]KQS56216.1 deaminase [Brevundimonas sp. Leaf363]